MPPSFRKARKTLSRLRPFRKRHRGAGPGGPGGASIVGASIGCAEPVKSDGGDEDLPSNSPVSTASGESVDDAAFVASEKREIEPFEVGTFCSAADGEHLGDTIAPASSTDSEVVEEEKEEIGSFPHDIVSNADNEDGRDEGAEGDRENRAEGERDEGISKTRTFASLATIVTEVASRDEDHVKQADEANNFGCNTTMFCGQVSLRDLWAGAVDVFDCREYKRDLVGEGVLACADPTGR